MAGSSSRKHHPPEEHGNNLVPSQIPHSVRPNRALLQRHITLVKQQHGVPPLGQLQRAPQPPPRPPPSATAPAALSTYSGPRTLSATASAVSVLMVAETLVSTRPASSPAGVARGRMDDTHGFNLQYLIRLQAI